MLVARSAIFRCCLLHAFMTRSPCCHSASMHVSPIHAWYCPVHAWYFSMVAMVSECDILCPTAATRTQSWQPPPTTCTAPSHPAPTTPCHTPDPYEAKELSRTKQTYESLLPRDRADRVLANPDVVLNLGFHVLRSAQLLLMAGAFRMLFLSRRHRIAMGINLDNKDAISLPCL